MMDERGQGTMFLFPAHFFLPTLVVDRLVQSRVQLPLSLMAAGPPLSQQLGLLTNDGLVVAVMANGLTRLASNDADFDRVPGITPYAPA